MQNDLQMIWNAIHQWEEDCLGGRTGRGRTDGEDDAEFEREFDSVCEAMARITERLELPTEREPETYNGWSNYATWRVGLEVFDGWSIDDTWSAEGWKEVINSKMELAITPDRNNEERSFWFRVEMASFMADYLSEHPAFDFDDGDGCKLRNGWSEAFVSEVNWRELAEHHLEMDALYNQALSNISEGAEVLY